MSNFQSNIPKKVVPTSYEYSSLRSPRDADSPFKIWSKMKESADVINQLIDVVTVLQEKCKKITDPQLDGFDFFPFKLYTLPTYFYATGSIVNWQTVYVRAGSVLNTYEDTRSYVLGTDNLNEFVDYDIIPFIPDPNTAVQVPISSSNYYFWINVVTGSITQYPEYQIMYGAQPSSSFTQSYYGAQAGLLNSGWSNWPSQSSTNFLIGYCDTLTSGSINQMFVRQYLRTDIMSSPVSYTPFNICQDGKVVTWNLAGYLLSGPM